ncbi:MAG: hypothetical protein KDD52_01705 [Bdellovibrionales bacterium]|nr:hypothetical protein [Bdellovibrionales bacterium]
MKKKSKIISFCLGAFLILFFFNLLGGLGFFPEIDHAWFGMMTGALMLGFFSVSLWNYWGIKSSLKEIFQDSESHPLNHQLRSLFFVFGLTCVLLLSGLFLKTHPYGSHIHQWLALGAGLFFVHVCTRAIFLMFRIQHQIRIQDKKTAK